MASSEPVIRATRCSTRLARDELVDRVRADTRSDAVSLIGITERRDQLLISELLELILRVPDGNDSPPVLERTRDVKLASLGKSPAFHDFRVDLVIHLLRPT